MSGSDHLNLIDQLDKIRMQGRMADDPEMRRSYSDEEARDEAYVAMAWGLAIGIGAIILVGLGLVGWIALVCVLLFPYAVYLHLKRAREARERREEQYRQFETGKNWGRKEER